MSRWLTILISLYLYQTIFTKELHNEMSSPGSANPTGISEESLLGSFPYLPAKYLQGWINHVWSLLKHHSLVMDSIPLLGNSQIKPGRLQYRYPTWSQCYRPCPTGGRRRAYPLWSNVDLPDRSLQEVAAELAPVCRTLRITAWKGETRDWEDEANDDDEHNGEEKDR